MRTPIFVLDHIYIACANGRHMEIITGFFKVIIVLHARHGIVEFFMLIFFISNRAPISAAACAAQMI